IYRPAEFWQLEDQAPQALKKRHGSSVFTLKEMEEATCSFSDDNLLGKGGFGKVYRGTLQGQVVAIKKMELPAIREAKGEREFRVEVDILSRLDHPTLVSLIGYCADGKHGFLILIGRRVVDLNQGPNDQNLLLQVRHLLNDQKKLRKVIDAEMALN
ncbi:hypothetical protein HN873_070832, partial [Arachis hypogaea]